MSNLTLDRLKAWLADEAQFVHKARYPENLQGHTTHNGFDHMGTRKHFITRNGYRISIQQSATHYCDGPGTVELWNCPPSPLLMAYGDGEDPYAYVPLEVVAGYIDSLESLPPKEQP